MTDVSDEVGLSGARRSGKGVLVFDYDADGDLDLFVVNNAGPPGLYRNDGGNAHGWLRIRAQGNSSNRDGIGVKVIVKKTVATAPQVREIGSPSHFLGQSERVAHFGLGAGDAPIYSVSIHWPSGLIGSYRNVPRNTVLLVKESDAH